MPVGLPVGRLELPVEHLELLLSLAEPDLALTGCRVVGRRLELHLEPREKLP